MEEPDTAHLTSEEIASLIGRADPERMPAGRSHHAQSCDFCKRVIAMHQEEDGRLQRLAGGPREGPGGECPSPADWASLAAGLVDSGRRSVLLAHASQCDACGAVLHAVVMDFSDDLNDTELQELGALESSKAAWQRNMARQMGDVARRGMGEAARRGPIPIHVRNWLAWAAALIVAAGAGWLGLNQWRAGDPARLIAQAYTERRPFEYRIPNADHAAVRQEKRSVGSFQRPPALLEAEAKIANGLKKSPDNVNLLDLEARAVMLGWDAETAIATLQRALELKPEDPDLLAELGVAYALRAEAQNRDVDYGSAIENLSRSLKAKPNSPVARFNLALVYERMYLYDDAMKQWGQYLELDSGAWGQEAQRHLAELGLKKKVRQTALSKISDDPDLLMRRLAEGGVDPESYQDVAVMQWLPRRWESARYERALGALAAGFEQRHADRWWGDVLASRPSDSLARGLAALSGAVESNQADDSDTALSKAKEAAALLRAAGSESAALRADFEYTYALERSLQSPECLNMAIALERKAAERNYSWILGQTILEQGTCRGRSGDSGTAHRDMLRALAQTRQSGYRDLELRAEGVLLGSQTIAGNLLAAWTLGRGGLATYWSGPYRGIRAHQIYFNLFRSAESLGQHQAAYVFGRAAAAAIAETPRRRTEAGTRARIARLAVEAGWPEEAKTEFERAAKLFGQLRQTKADREYQARGELDRAEVEVAAGSPQPALERLETIRAQAKDIGAVVQIRFQQTLGDAHRQSGRKQEAESAYRLAIQLSEHRLGTLPASRERAGLMLVAGEAYRGLAELAWEKGEQTQALRLWEWFRAGEAPGRRDQPDLDRRLPHLRNEQFLSYAILPGGGMAAWVFDDRGVEAWQLAVRPEELEVVASRFLRQCSDPKSSLGSLRRDGRLLYDWLLAPLVHRLDPARALVIEPDGPLRAIPMQALMDENFRYLGDRFAITVASSLADYQSRAATGTVNAGSQALVVAGPVLGNEMTRAFPPLAQTIREGQAVARHFRRAVLLQRGQATLAAVEQHRQSTELFHFAGHGFSNAGNGGLLLAPDADGGVGSGVLDGLRMSRRDWSRCRLAVLSACSTGTGETGGPVNPESLVRGLLWAGVARVVATRWNVDADTGERLMESFYEALLSGDDVATALQRGARRFRESPNTSHPYYWAGFQSFGTR